MAHLQAVVEESQVGHHRAAHHLHPHREVYLNYAEALAELGQLDQTALDISVNKIRERAKMPALDMAAANGNIDPFLASCYPRVQAGANQGVILEIRRERTIELVNEGFRQWDMLRWKEGEQMVNKIRFEFALIDICLPKNSGYFKTL